MLKGAAATAQLYRFLVETAKTNGQELYTWLSNVLERLPRVRLVAVMSTVAVEMFTGNTTVNGDFTLR